MTVPTFRRSAVFLDRDGTIIEDTDYPADLVAVRLLPGAASAIRRLNRAGALAIVVTNQSGIARGQYSEETYYRIERQVDALLASEGAQLDAHYFCPHLPEITGPCECRKPGTLLYRQAAERFGIDLARSWWVGDRLRDLQPAVSFGARGILVLTGQGSGDASAAQAAGFDIKPDLAGAVDRLLQ